MAGQNMQREFAASAGHYCKETEVIGRLWKEIGTRYGETQRHYHTLVHTEAVLHELMPYKGLFSDWNAVVFAIAYHDIIYNVLRTDNEEKSALFAEAELQKIRAAPDVVRRCRDFILATKKHIALDPETDLFTDADLAILGSDHKAYRVYAEQVRMEYQIFPDLIYRPGRKKVLRRFLEMKRIFKTEPFVSRYEEQARRNIAWELGAF